MKLNLDKQFVNLLGHPLSDKMDDTLATVLSLATTGEANKMIEWATQLIKDGEIDIDLHDLIYLKLFIETQPILTNLAKSQLIDQINSLIKN